MASSDDRRQTVERLKRGRTALSREEVNDIQRARILSAMIEVAANVGYLGAAVAPVVARAGVSRRTFYELFDGREDCFLAAFQWGVAQAREAMVAACASQRSWRERVRHALATLLALLDSEPALARVCVIEALAAGKLVLERRAAVLDELIVALDAHAPRSPGVANAPLLTAEGIVGGAFSVIHARVLEHAAAGARDGMGLSGRPKGSKSPRGVAAARPLIELHGQLMALIALPYLGARIAGEELMRQAPELSARTGVTQGEDGGRLLERLDMRLTYRTVLCLLFIGEHPGSSNREIAQGAQVPDEGQTSKLLARLTRLGLIANTMPHGPGQPNYWTLTPQGRHVLGAVHSR